MALTMPIGSVGYLLIFLIMQPKAMLCCKQLLTCQTIDLTSETDKRNSLEAVEFAMNDNYATAGHNRSESDDYFNRESITSINSLTSVLLHDDGIEDVRASLDHRMYNGSSSSSSIAITNPIVASGDF